MKSLKLQQATVFSDAPEEQLDSAKATLSRSDTQKQSVHGHEDKQCAKDAGQRTRGLHPRRKQRARSPEDMTDQARGIVVLALNKIHIN